MNMDKKKSCSKIRFETRSEAKKHLKEINRKRKYGKNQKTVYLCDCGYYHTSSMSKAYYLKREIAYQKYKPGS